MPTTRTQIIITLGPASCAEPICAQLLEAGTDAVRLNFSHGTYDEHAGCIAHVRAYTERTKRRVPIIQDLSGPRGKTTDGHSFDSTQAEITEKDLRDLDFGIEHKVEYIAQSYVGSARDVESMRAEIKKRGASIPIIAKIERAEAVRDFGAILAVSDAIMIARGDLGLAEPLGEIPFIERDIIQKCNAAQKPVIVATQMLYSMVENPEPTRAEVTDVAYAITLGADALLLSDETARGKYPLEAVKAMDQIIRRAEQEQGSVDRHFHFL